MNRLIEENLRNEYTKNELTQGECAKLFGVSKRTIATYMQKWCIPGRIKRNDNWRERLSLRMKGSANPMYGKRGNKHPNFKYDDEYLLQKLKDIVHTLGRAPKVLEVDNNFRMQLTRHFRSYNKALDMVGEQGRPNHGPKVYSDEEIITELKRLSVNGYAPTEQEVNTLAKRAIYRFGSYSNVVALAGLKHKPRARCGDLNGNWKGGYKEYYGPNWEEQRRLARERDKFRCQLCNISEQDLGRQLDVHHKTPFREFSYIVGENDNYLDANKINNLISLCYKCHSKLQKS